MKAFLHWLHLRTHHHEWEIYKEDPLKILDYYNPDVIKATGSRFVLRCKICGEIKHKDVV